MPTAGGPNTLGESNLVFAYDTGDVKNSYKGQPTVNALGTLSTDLFSWVTTGNSCTLTRDTIASPVGNTPLKMVTTGNDPYTNTYNSTGNNIAAASSGQTWTISVWAKANQNTTGQIFHFGANSSGNYIDFSYIVISLTTEWTRYVFTRTFTDGNVVAIQARLDGPDTFQSGVVVWWDGLQVEQKAYATQFVDGTRSVTQGLLPLVGNSTLNLTNMSFDSNAQMVFDGTNDYFTTSTTPTSLQGNSSFTVEGIFKRNSDIYQQGFWGIGGGDTLQGICSWNTGLTNEIGIDLWGTSTYGTGQTYSTTEWKHIVWTYNGTSFTTSNISIFVNGVKYAGGSLITRRGGSGIPNINNSGITLGRIHSSTNGYYANGQVPIFKAYNKILSDFEVRQNYQQYKTRFNLS
jgi:hypothetical protein